MIKPAKSSRAAAKNRKTIIDSDSEDDDDDFGWKEEGREMHVSVYTRLTHATPA